MQKNAYGQSSRRKGLPDATFGGNARRAIGAITLSILLKIGKRPEITGGQKLDGEQVLKPIEG